MLSVLQVSESGKSGSLRAGVTDSPKAPQGEGRRGVGAFWDRGDQRFGQSGRLGRLSGFPDPRKGEVDDPLRSEKNPRVHMT